MDKLFLFFLLILNITLSANCLKVFVCEAIPSVYYEKYGYGYEIKCNNLNYTQAGQDRVVIENKISLQITNSVFKNVTSELFDNVQDIRLLTIVNSSFYLVKSAPFRYLKKLDSLHIERTIFNGSNYDIFAGLNNVNELNLINNSNLKFSKISELKELQVLKVCNNSIARLSDIQPCSFSKLKYLNVQHNNIETVTEFDFMCQTSYIADTNFNINGHDIAINSNSVGSTQTSSLIEIDLSFNRIRQIESLNGAFKLKYLSLEGNRLERLDDNLFNLVNGVVKINLKSNLIKEISGKLFSKLENLEVLSLEHNSLVNVKLNRLPALKILNLSFNKLKLIHKIRELDGIEHLFLNDNVLDEFPVENFVNSTNLVELNLSKNIIGLKNKSWKFPNLQKLYLNNNSINVVPDLFFSNMKNLIFLDLSYNDIETINDIIFSPLENLISLNISHNKITYISSKSLDRLLNLQIFDIAGNQLINFNFATVPLTLRVINIKNNLISCVNLEKIIVFLKSKNITYTIHEKFEYDRENIAGISCNNESTDMQETRALHNKFVIFCIAIVAILLMILLTYGFYKLLRIFYARKYNYFSNDIELMDDIHFSIT